MAARAHRVEFFQHAIEQGQPRGVRARSRQDIGSDLLQHPYRVVGGESPERIVEGPEEGSRIWRPTPPEVVGQVLEPAETFGQQGHYAVPRVARMRRDGNTLLEAGWVRNGVS